MSLKIYEVYSCKNNRKAPLPNLGSGDTIKCMKKTVGGFTIVELLIVIVVIAILAAISIAVYNGVQQRADNSAISSDLRNAAQNIMVFKALEGHFPQSESELMAVPRMSFSRSSYPVMTANSLMYTVCMASGTEIFVVAGARKTGGGIYYSSSEGLRHMDTWSSTGAELRPMIGCGPSDFGSWGHSASGGWRAWAAQ